MTPLLSIPLLIGVLSLGVHLLRLPVFPTVLGVLLTAPLTGYVLAATGIPLNSASYILVLAATFAILWVATRNYRAELVADGAAASTLELRYPLLFILSFIACYLMCLTWQDFYPLGERMRDYAIISSVIAEPYRTTDPWMSGVHLPYYLYWYRFGHMFSCLCGLEVWEVYHTLVAWAPAMLCTVLAYLFCNLCQLSFLTGMLLSLIITWGSNVAGVITAFKGDVQWSTWWAASRVIQGTINEFPAWSFLLGDAHPHFLNQSTFLLMVALGASSLGSSLRVQSRPWLIIVLAITSVPFAFVANAWEAPLVGLHVGALLSVLGFRILADRSLFKEHLRLFRSSSDTPFVQLLTFAAVVLTLLLGCILMSHAVPAGGTPFAKVAPPIAVTTLNEFAHYFGIPLGLLSISIILLAPTRFEALISFILLVIGIFTSPALGFILVLLTLVAREASKDLNNQPLSQMVINSLAVVSLAILMIPEIVFLNDPYGGENERMNTIFKVYSFSWPVVHFVAFAFAARALAKFSAAVNQKLNALTIPTLIIALTILGSFTYLAALKVRRDGCTFSWDGQGLERVNKEHPGSKATIQFLRNLPYNQVLLEAQNGAYNYSSHVASLGHHQAYLGWANHMELLTKRYEEVRRRTNVTASIYETKGCTERAELLRQEGISLLVVGPLERERYPGVVNGDFSCLRVLFSGGGYFLYGRKSG